VSIRSLSTLAIATFLLLTSCPNPIPSELAGQINDTDGPVISITEPTDRSEYSTVVRVSGTVTDDADTATATRIAACSFAVAGTSVGSGFEIDDAGAFSFLFATTDVEGTALFEGVARLEVAARDWSGNETIESVEIVPATTGAVPGFSVTPGNREVTLEWDEVPGAESYSLHSLRYHDETREDVPYPYVWDNLVNGQLYDFQLRAVMPEGIGVDAWSDTQEAIPLSERTLAPWVIESEYRSITIGWDALAVPTEFVIERSEADGPWIVHSITDGTTLSDSGLAHDTTYAYRVTPILRPDIVSASISAVPGRFPDLHVEYVGLVDQSEPTYKFAISGNCAFTAAKTAGWKSSMSPILMHRFAWTDATTLIRDTSPVLP
jgi:hypothetical protein